MTKELLSQGTMLDNRIKNVNRLLEQLEENQPLVVQAGMAQTIQFDLKGCEDLTQLQEIDKQIYTLFVGTLKGYKNRLQEMFDNLA